MSKDDCDRTTGISPPIFYPLFLQLVSHVIDLNIFFVYKNQGRAARYERSVMKLQV